VGLPVKESRVLHAESELLPESSGDMCEEREGLIGPLRALGINDR
jgi:hypothetical protein